MGLIIRVSERGYENACHSILAQNLNTSNKPKSIKRGYLLGSLSFELSKNVGSYREKKKT